MKTFDIGPGVRCDPDVLLNTRLLIQANGGGRLALTAEGRARAKQPDVPLTTDELHRRVLQRLPGPEQRLLVPLLQAYPQPMSNEALAQAAGYTPGAGAFNNPRGRLRSLGLVDYPQPGHVVAKPVLFLEA